MATTVYCFPPLLLLLLLIESPSAGPERKRVKRINRTTASSTILLRDGSILLLSGYVTDLQHPPALCV